MAAAAAALSLRVARGTLIVNNGLLPNFFLHSVRKG
jgi:hypothetical protein